MCVVWRTKRKSTVVRKLIVAHNVCLFGRATKKYIKLHFHGTFRVRIPPLQRLFDGSLIATTACSLSLQKLHTLAAL